MRDKARRVLARHGGDVSTLGLLTSGSHKLAKFGAGTKLMGPLSAVSGIGLAAHSLGKAKRSSTLIERAEATHGLAWGAQAILAFAGQIQGKGGSAAVASLGVIGGGVQTAIGLRRIVDGVRKRNWSDAALGSLDVGAGVSWAISSLSPGNPISLGAFIGFSAARVAFANRGTIKRKVRGWFSREGAGGPAAPAGEPGPPPGSPAPR